MSEMATIPVFKCRKCGTPVYVTHLSTTRSDPDSAQLKQFMANLGSIALCDTCRKAYAYYAQQNRTNEFWLNPRSVILNVHDHSGLDYYRKKG